jgi:pyruvate/2-oxoglutarate dehydrogenase complex dihydrolipoamide dehydrogenase (E3) component
VNPTRPDVLVIGGGAAGLAAAFGARWRGKRVTIVQDGPIGGDCTFTGCVPSKALLAAAAAGRGFDEAMDEVRAAVGAIAAEESAEALKVRGIDVIEGRARFTAPGRVDVDGTELRADRVVLAAGSRAAVPPIPGLSDTPHVTNHDLWQLPELPARLVIVGGGPIGCEMAQAFSTLGSKVTVVEGVDQLLPRDDAEAAAVITESLQRRGVAVRTGMFAGSVKSGDDGVIEVAVGDEVIEADRVLVATGRAPAFDDLGLEVAGVSVTDRGWIEVDEHLATTADGIYAAGDAVGSIQLTHAAGAMAQVAVSNALGVGMARFRKQTWRTEHVPWVTFTTPEVGQVGWTEAQAADVKGARVATLSMGEVDRAVATGRTHGFIKLIAAPRPIVGNLGGGKLIGATVVADRAGELVGELALAVRTSMFVGRLAQTVHPYPTWSMAISQAATQFFTDAFTGKSARPPAA